MSNLGCVVLYEGKMLDDFLGSLKSQYSPEKFIKEYSNEREEVRDVLKSVASGFMDRMNEKDLQVLYSSYKSGRAGDDYMCNLIVEALLKKEVAENDIKDLYEKEDNPETLKVLVAMLVAKINKKEEVIELYYKEKEKNESDGHRRSKIQTTMILGIFKRPDIEIEDVVDLIWGESSKSIKEIIEDEVINRAESVSSERLLKLFEETTSKRPITIREILAREIANRNDIEPHVLYNLYKREERDSVMRIWVPKLKEGLAE